jgi:hypothetical protein
MGKGVTDERGRVVNDRGRTGRKQAAAALTGWSRRPVRGVGRRAGQAGLAGRIGPRGSCGCRPKAAGLDRWVRPV